MTEDRWRSRVSRLDGVRAERVRIEDADGPLSYAEVARLWRKDAAFRSFHVRLLADSPFDAFVWETPPVTETSIERDFEFVCIEEPLLAGARPEPEAFRDRFEAAAPGTSVVTFANLGGDALLVAPCPRAASDAYSHLAGFARGAPEDQQQELWRAVGEALEHRVGSRPVWLSTAGLGVFWLHVRLDSWPKYYRHAPYREATFSGGSGAG